MNKLFAIFNPVFGFLLITGSLFVSPGLKAQSDEAGEAGFYIIGDISISGNKITRSQIILRELPIKRGDTIAAHLLEIKLQQAQENLINTSLFNFADLKPVFPEGADHLMNIQIDVTERWYIWPYPILKFSDRNFNVWWETKDFSRLSYGLRVDWNNFRGRKEILSMQLQFGYDRVVAFQYTNPYLNKAKTLGVSFGAGMWQQKETAVETIDNRHRFYEDTSTFARQDLYCFGQVIFRPDLYNSHLIELRYDHHRFSDGLLTRNENYSIDQSNDVRYVTLRYWFKNDRRDYKHYPLKGHYFDLELVKHGLFSIGENSLNTFHLLTSFRKYWELHPRIYFAGGINGKVSAGDQQPYFIIRGIGYDRDIIRGYEYYVVDAVHFGILKNNLKFSLVPMRVSEFGFIKSEKFRKFFYALYLNFYFDAGYGAYRQDFGQETNDLQNTLLLGYGTGLDFVTYYDIVIRFELSVNRMNEAGFFLHFRAPI